MLTNVTELLKIQMRVIICWYFAMLLMEIYIIIYQKILKKLLGMIKFFHFIGFHKGRFLIFYYSTIPIDQFYYNCHFFIFFIIFFFFFFFIFLIFMFLFF